MLSCRVNKPGRLYNLVDVYLDAVFAPLLSEMTFEQEGWHYEVDPSDRSLSYKGVVFNEMKGVIRSGNHTATPTRSCSRHDIPATPVRPVAIPSLTYDEFKQFHRDHYNPSNAFLFFGDDPEEQRLKIVEDCINNMLGTSPSGPAAGAIEFQTLSTKPFPLIRMPYASAGGEDGAEGPCTTQ